MPTGGNAPCPGMDTARNLLKNAEELLSKELYNSAATVLNEALSAYQGCVEPADSNSRLLCQIHYRLGYAWYHLADYEKALSSFYEIIKLNPVEDYALAQAYTGITNVANARKDPETARQASRKILEINKNLQDKNIELSSYNNLANTYAQMEEYDSALLFLEHAYELSFRIPDSTGRHMSIILNMANDLQMMQRFEEAEYYYKKGLKELENTQNQYIRIQFQYGLGSVYLKQGRDREGLGLLQSALDEAETLHHQRLALYIHRKLGQYHYEAGHYKTAYDHLRKEQILNDSIFSIENERNINRLKADFDIYQIETSKQLLERDLAISKNKLFRRNLNIVILSLLTLGAIGSLVFIIRRLTHRNQEYLSLHNQFDSLQNHIDLEKQKINERFQSELELKHKELTTNALLLVKSEEIAGDILENVKRLKTNLKGENAKTLQEIENLAQELYMGKGWEEFRHSFEQVNSFFYTNLDARYPGLTPSDRRFAALLSLGLTTKEIALMTNRSVRGVETSKFRLKKKMGLDASENLIQVLMDLK